MPVDSASVREWLVAGAVIETDELKPKARGSLREVVTQFDRWRAQLQTVSHTELEKCADKWFGKLNKLNVGDKFDLAQGHDFRGQIVDACKAMVEAHKRFEVSTETMKQFAFMVAAKDQRDTIDRAVEVAAADKPAA